MLLEIFKNVKIKIDYNMIGLMKHFLSKAYACHYLAAVSRTLNELIVLEILHNSFQQRLYKRWDASETNVVVKYFMAYIDGSKGNVYPSKYMQFNCITVK